VKFADGKENSGPCSSEVGDDGLPPVGLRAGDLAGLKEAQRTQSLTGLTRLLRFLRETGRLDDDVADVLLDLLKGKA
jgi:hypothetical protein